MTDVMKQIEVLRNHASMSCKISAQTFWGECADSLERLYAECRNLREFLSDQGLSQSEIEAAASIEVITPVSTERANTLAEACAKIPQDVKDRLARQTEKPVDDGRCEHEWRYSLHNSKRYCINCGMDWLTGLTPPAEQAQEKP